jgi:hypothetical protein
MLFHEMKSLNDIVITVANITPRIFTRTHHTSEYYLRVSASVEEFMITKNLW